MSPDLKEKRTLAVRLGEVLRKARLEASLTQADVAERAGLVTEVYGRVERGRMLPSLPKLRKLCLVLRVDANNALRLVGHEEPVWLEENTGPTLNDSPRMRRLQRTLRGLDEEQLAALHVMAHTLAKLSHRRSPPVAEEREPAPGPLTT
ncbi:MAG TPA: helix-turn-helix transcriptional regulator [Archangium sp.]|jgi:transcriptional regulator with XRE-family HTH domain|uniref:helix-turn-helix transcriptional regulator n=1 Tax=Archangium sp. TaxID=1872627 RepID=UPI002EDB30F7